MPPHPSVFLPSLANTQLRLQPIDVLRCLGLAEISRQFLARLPGKGVEIALLRRSHRVAAADPIAGVLLQRRVSVILRGGTNAARFLLWRLIDFRCEFAHAQTVIMPSDSATTPGRESLESPLFNSPDMINFTLIGHRHLELANGRQRPPAGGAHGGSSRDSLRASTAARLGRRRAGVCPPSRRRKP